MRRVDEDERSFGMRSFDDGLDRIDRPRAVGNVGNRDNGGILCEELVKSVEIELSPVIDGYIGDVCTVKLPRNDIGVVLHFGEDHFFPAKVRSDEVDPIGGSPREDDFI